MKRRTWLLGGAGVAAAAAGAAWQLRRSADAPEPLAPALWAQRFPQPDGSVLALESLRGRPLVVNFWATWCAPCVKEMPELDRFAREHAAAGWEVVGVAIDSAAPVREFLRRSPVAFKIALAGFEGSGFLRDAGNTEGVLPYTIVVDRRGRIVQRKLGPTEAAELARWAAAAG